MSPLAGSHRATAPPGQLLQNQPATAASRHANTMAQASAPVSDRSGCPHTTDSPSRAAAHTRQGGVVSPGVPPSNPTPTVTVAVYLADWPWHPWRQMRAVGVFVSYAPPDTVGDRRPGAHASEPYWPVARKYTATGPEASCEYAPGSAASVSLYGRAPDALCVRTGGREGTLGCGGTCPMCRDTQRSGQGGTCGQPPWTGTRKASPGKRRRSPVRLAPSVSRLGGTDRTGHPPRAVAAGVSCYRRAARCFPLGALRCRQANVGSHLTIPAQGKAAADRSRRDYPGVLAPGPSHAERRQVSGRGAVSAATSLPCQDRRFPGTHGSCHANVARGAPGKYRSFRPRQDTSRAGPEARPWEKH
jgi:hypothetical protein